MAARIPIEKKAAVIRLFDEGANCGHIALCMRLKQSTVEHILRQAGLRRFRAKEYIGCQEERPSLDEIYARRDAIRDSWSEEEREKRLASAYRPLPAITECEVGGKHWNGVMW